MALCFFDRCCLFPDVLLLCPQCVEEVEHVHRPPHVGLSHLPIADRCHEAMVPGLYAGDALGVVLGEGWPFALSAFVVALGEELREAAL
jgi:hypothetical protein